jgi:hypothetical protein
MIMKKHESLGCSPSTFLYIYYFNLLLYIYYFNLLLGAAKEDLDTTPSL